MNNNDNEGGTVSVLTLILFGTCLILSLLYYKGCKQSDHFKNQSELINGLQDSLTYTTNSLGQEKATTTLLLGSIDELQSIHIKDSSRILDLQKIVNDKTISATVVKTITKEKIVNKTIVIHDTIITCDTICYPTYAFNKKDNWIDLKAIANKDSFAIDYTITNDFSIEQRWEKVGQWPNRKQRAVIDITNKNPHTSTDELKSFVVTPPKSEKQKWFLGGLVLGGALTFFLAK